MPFSWRKLFGDQPIRGALGYYGLSDWWCDAFTEAEREYVERVYRPRDEKGRVRTGALTKGPPPAPELSAAAFLTDLTRWFRRQDDLSIARRLLARAEERASDLIDRHFVYQELVQLLYRARHEDPGALNEVITTCHRQIGVATETAAAFLAAYTEGEAEARFGARLPSHQGYRTLATMLEEDRKISAALEILRRARSQGWAGTWDTDIARCERKELGLVP